MKLVEDHVGRFAHTLNIVEKEVRVLENASTRLFSHHLIDMAETPGSVIDNLNRMEKLRLLGDVRAWLLARKLRNKLVHEYVEDPAEFAEALNQAKEFAGMMIETAKSMRQYAENELGLPLALYNVK